MLFLVGSASPVACAQVEALIAAGAESIVIDVDAVLDSGARAASAEVRRRIQASSRGVIVVHTGATATSEHVTSRRLTLGWSERELATRLREPFGSALDAMPDAGLFLVGGETTGALFDLGGWRGLRSVDEHAPAVPVAHVMGDTSHPFVLTKPGAFGASSTLVAAADRFLPSWRDTSTTVTC
jgi:uncharacterized protein YgbK (DUF1537 family)